MLLHNKYFEIIKEFTGDYNKRLYGRGLKTLMSQKAISLALIQLQKKGILKSEKKGNMKFYSLNVLNPKTKDVLILTEIQKKLVFLSKNPALREIFKEDKRIVGIFGSHARNEQKSTLDIDIFIIGEKNGIDYEKTGKTFDLPISTKIFSEKEWKALLKIKNNLAKEIIKDHILIFGVESFIRIVWQDFYGFD